MRPILNEMYERNLIKSFGEGRRLIANGAVSIGKDKVTDPNAQIEYFSTIKIGNKDYPYSMYTKMKGVDVKEEQNSAIEMKGQAQPPGSELDIDSFTTDLKQHAENAGRDLAELKLGVPKPVTKEGPEWTCCGCGNQDPDKFLTIKREIVGEPTDYSMKCLVCSSDKVEESSKAALGVLIEEVNRLKGELEAKVTSETLGIEALLKRLEAQYVPQWESGKPACPVCGEDQADDGNVLHKVDCELGLAREAFRKRQLSVSSPYEKVFPVRIDSEAGTVFAMEIKSKTVSGSLLAVPGVLDVLKPLMTDWVFDVAKKPEMDFMEASRRLSAAVKKHEGWTFYLPDWPPTPGKKGPSDCNYCYRPKSEHREEDSRCPIKGCSLSGPPKEG